MNKRVGLLALCLMTLALGARAQSSNTRGDVLMRQARSSDRLQKIDLLRSFEDGSISVDEDSIRALGLLAGMGTVWRDSSAGVDYADVRAGALTVLGNSGSADARAIVLHVVDHETHPMVLVAGFEAIGKLGAGDDMLAVRILNEAQLRNMARTRNNSVADEYMKAIEQLVDMSNPDMQTIEVLTEMSHGSALSYGIRTRANELLKKFW